MIVGALPASGSATRLNGIPKFLLPIEKGCLLTWHINQMLEVCDEVRVSIRPVMRQLISEMELPSEVKVYELAPNSFLDAARLLLQNDRGVIGMPDTYIKNSEENIYKNLVASKSDITLSGFACPDYLKGQVGQISTDQNGNLLDVQDKITGCAYPDMWGAIGLNNAELKAGIDELPFQIRKWITQGKSIKVAQCKGDYIDAGTFNGLEKLYAL